MRRSEPDVDDGRDIVAEPDGGEDEARGDIADDYTPTPRDDVGDRISWSRPYIEEYIRGIPTRIKKM